MGLSKRQTLAVQKAIKVLTSGVLPGSQDDENTIEHIPSNRCGCPLEELKGAEMRNGAMARLSRLDRRELAVVRQRFGLDGEDPVTLKELGERLGCTKGASGRSNAMPWRNSADRWLLSSCSVE